MAEEEQMEAVFKSSRVDPVSGNDVPTGSLPEEVRDDIDAKLSEGEYVVPADVVRYFGVRFFEDLRNQAKQGWSDMESNGRVGGEPISGMEVIEPEDDLPFDISELEVVEAAEGGYIKGYADGGVATQTISVKKFVGPDGQVIFVTFSGDTPLGAIPPGYVESGSEVAEAAPETTPAVEEAPTPRKTSSRRAAVEEDRPDPIDWTTASADQFQEYLDQRNSFVGKIVKGGVSALGGPLMGMAFKAADRFQFNSMMKGLDAQLDNPDLDPDVARQLAAIKAEAQETSNNGGRKAFGGETRPLKGLTDVSDNGRVGLGDTWLGDVLGLDGQFGVQGPSLKESRAGARRGKTTTTEEAPSSPAAPSKPKRTRVTGIETTGDGKGFYENVTGKEFKETKLGKFLGFEEGGYVEKPKD